MYFQNNCGFLKDCSFLVISKSPSFKYNWFLNPLHFDIGIHELLRTQTTGKSLSRFDGISMVRYQITHKMWENQFCATTIPTDPPYECSTIRGINPNIKDFRMDMFEVKSSTLGEGSGRGLFAKVDIPKGSLIMEQEHTDSIHMTGEALEIIEGMMSEIPEAEEMVTNLSSFYNGYGFSRSVTVSAPNDVCIYHFLTTSCDALDP